MRILITNSVPLNGGDEALLRALVNSLKIKYNNPVIHVLCMNLGLCRKYLPDINFESDLEFTEKNISDRNKRIRSLLINRLHFSENSNVCLSLLNKSERKTLQLYKKADIVISSPGGFLHDFYPIRERLIGFEHAIKLGKKVIICGQSVGPFWKADSETMVPAVFKKLHKIYLRDQLSFDNLKRIGVTSPNVEVTADVAFLWRYLRPDLYIKKKGPVKKIALSFRNWSYENSNMDLVFENAVKLCRLILSDESKEIYFLSTCQGIQGCVDDSDIAEKIVSALSKESKNRIHIDKKRYTPENLIMKYSEYDAYIGMRLHGAILAMLGGTVAMGLGYEEKTKGIFSQLGLEEFQVDSSSEFSKWENTYHNFIESAENIREQLPLQLDKLSKMALKNIEF